MAPHTHPPHILMALAYSPSLSKQPEITFKRRKNCECCPVSLFFWCMTVLNALMITKVTVISMALSAQLPNYILSNCLNCLNYQKNHFFLQKLSKITKLVKKWYLAKIFVKMIKSCQIRIKVSWLVICSYQCFVLCSEVKSVEVTQWDDHLLSCPQTQTQTLTNGPWLNKSTF